MSAPPALTLDLEAVNNEREENFEASYEFSGKTLVVDGFRINETGITAAPREPVKHSAHSAHSEEHGPSEGAPHDAERLAEGPWAPRLA